MATSLKNWAPFIPLTSLFFMWGFSTVLNDILIPHLKVLFNLSYVKVMLVQFSFFMAYGTMSIPLGKLLHKLGYNKALILAPVIGGFGCMFFIPAAAFASYPLFLVGLFTLATGIVLIQVAGNPFIALLGNPDSAMSRSNLVQGFNSLGTAIAPPIGAYLILSSFSPAKIEILYLFLAISFFVLSFILFITKLPDIQTSIYESYQINLSKKALKKFRYRPPEEPELKKAWIYPHLIWGTLAIFFYVGAEVSIGSFLVNFLSNPSTIGFSTVAAGRLISVYWGGAMVGRFIGTFLLLKIEGRTLLAISSVVNIFLLIVIIFGKGYLSAISILSIGFFNSTMYPTIFPISIAGLDEFTPKASGVLCSAVVGGAFIPLFQGYLADIKGLHICFIVPLICYLYILYFAIKGSIAHCKLSGSTPDDS